MIKLIDGKGQLGDALENLVKKEEQDIEAIIYHTWNFLDKSEEIQKKCYEKFIKFVDEHNDSKVFFISTYSETENYYNFYKQLSEAYLLTNNPKGYVIRLPTLIGKGICQKFRDNQAESFGEIEMMTIEDAAKEILNFSKKDSLIRNIRLKGVSIPANIVKNLILFGRDGK